MSSTPAQFLEELIQSVDPAGREAYRDTMEDSPRVTGCRGRIAGIYLRIIKGINRLGLKEAQLTRNGLATADARIFDCGAAMVRNVDGQWKRYSGKDSAHPTRIFSGYDENSGYFSLWSQDDEGNPLTEKKAFHASVLAQKRDKIVSARFGTGGELQGVLEDGAVTQHIRDCLRQFEADVESIGILLRHPDFQRSSDTRNAPEKHIDTLFSDGAQIHLMNRRTVLEWQNALMQQPMDLNAYRAGIEIDGGDMNPSIEDRIAEVDVRTQRDGQIPLNFTSLTPRCPVIQRDPVTGEFRTEPKRWLRTYRPLRPSDGKPTMGANVDVDPEYGGAIIRVGDRFTVRAAKTDWSR